MSAEGQGRPISTSCAHRDDLRSQTLPIFALGCVQAAKQGGETRIFDAYKAAAKLHKEHPELAEVAIEYTTGAYKHATTCHPLLAQDQCGRFVLRYRANVPTNRVVNHPDPDTVYAPVDEALAQSIAASHRWEVGDILFVNNMATLHDRLPYEGNRVMLRVRFGDPHNEFFRY